MQISKGCSLQRKHVPNVCTCETTWQTLSQCPSVPWLPFIKIMGIDIYSCGPCPVWCLHFDSVLCVFCPVSVVTLYTLFGSWWLLPALIPSGPRIAMVSWIFQFWGTKLTFITFLKLFQCPFPIITTRGENQKGRTEVTHYWSTVKLVVHWWAWLSVRLAYSKWSCQMGWSERQKRGAYSWGYVYQLCVLEGHSGKIRGQVFGSTSLVLFWNSH